MVGCACEVCVRLYCVSGVVCVYGGSPGVLRTRVNINTCPPHVYPTPLINDKHNTNNEKNNTTT